MTVSPLRVPYFLLLLVALVFLSVMMPEPVVSADASIPSQSAAAPAFIATAPPSLRTFTTRLPLTGTVFPQSKVHLTTLIPGRIEIIEAADEAMIEKGRPVLHLGGEQIDSQRFLLSQEVTSLTTRLDLADRTVERLRLNLQTHLATKNQLAEARDRQARLKAQLDQARVKSEAFARRVTLSAPISGIFTQRRVDVGQDITTGQVVGDIIDTAHLRIKASLFSRPGLALWGKKVEIRLNDNRGLPASITGVLPQADQAGTIQVWIEGPKIDKNLRAGQNVAGDVEINTGTKCLAVPLSALVYDQREKPLVFVRNNGVYEQTPIRAGLTRDGWVQILSGLSRDQSVVIHGAYELYYRGFDKQFKVQD